MKNKVCIVIPVYKDKLTDIEECSVRNTIKKMKDIDIFFVTFIENHTKYYEQFGNIKFSFFDKSFFDNIASYNKLLLSTKFYGAFLMYKYMLIVQPDAYILKDENILYSFMEKKFDYWGAPWPWGCYIKNYYFSEKSFIGSHEILQWLLQIKDDVYYVGNGGLSLRNIKKTFLLLTLDRVRVKNWTMNEDSYFAVASKRSLFFRTAPQIEANKFAMEEDMHKAIRTKQIPFGVHAWEVYDPEFIEEAEQIMSLDNK